MLGIYNHPRKKMYLAMLLRSLCRWGISWVVFILWYCAPIHAWCWGAHCVVVRIGVGGAPIVRLGLPLGKLAVLLLVVCSMAGITVPKQSSAAMNSS
jgi:hypothetical protein